MKHLAYSELTNSLYFLPTRGQKVDITKDVDEFIKFRFSELFELINEIIKEEEAKFNSVKNDADFFNNNTPNVGITIDYKSYPPLSKRISKLKNLIQID